MNRSKNLLFLLFLFWGHLQAQQLEKEALVGFDQPREGISQGKIDTITYASETEGNERKALIYTPILEYSVLDGLPQDYLKLQIHNMLL